MIPRKDKKLILAMLVACLLLLAPGLAHAVKVGEMAPGFNLIATTGKKINLNQYRGKSMVLVEFYVADFGPT